MRLLLNLIEHITIAMTSLYPECRIGNVVASHAEGCKVDSQLNRDCTDLFYARGAQGVLLIWVVGATSQLDLPSLMPLSVAGLGRMQLGVSHWSTLVDCCKTLIIDPTFCGSRFSHEEDPGHRRLYLYCTFKRINKAVQCLYEVTKLKYTHNQLH